MADGVIQGKRLADDRVPLSTFVRSLFLEQILFVGSECHGATAKVLTSLKEEGWRYGAEDNSWEYFLRDRGENYLATAEAVKILNTSVAKDVWSLGVWRELKRNAAGATGDRYTVSPTVLSQHFAMFSGMIAGLLASSGCAESSKHADAFVCESLGFPEDLGTPLDYIRSRGEARLRYYANLHWSRYQFGPEIYETVF